MVVMEYQVISTLEAQHVLEAAVVEVQVAILAELVALVGEVELALIVIM